MKSIVLMGITLLLAACGPAFTVDPKYLEGPAPTGSSPIDPALDAAGPFASGDASDAGEIRADGNDAGDVLEDAGTHVPSDARTPVDAGDVLEASAPVDAEQLDAGEVPDVHVPLDAGVPPPPPSLCCNTPCSGSQVAAIACSSQSEWTCSAGPCGGNVCGVGAICHWMGTSCTGTVAVCP